MTRRRYELTDHEWSILSPLLPNKPRGVPHVDDRLDLCPRSPARGSGKKGAGDNGGMGRSRGRLTSKIHAHRRCRRSRREFRSCDDPLHRDPGSQLSRSCHLPCYGEKLFISQPNRTCLRLPVAKSTGGPRTDFIGKVPTEFLHPKTHGLVRNNDPTRREQSRPREIDGGDKGDHAQRGSCWKIAQADRLQVSLLCPLSLRRRAGSRLNKISARFRSRAVANRGNGRVRGWC